MTLDEACEEAKGVSEIKQPEYNIYSILDNLKVIEQIHYVVKHDTLKQPETLKLLELRDKIINSL